MSHFQTLLFLDLLYISEFGFYLVSAQFCYLPIVSQWEKYQRDHMRISSAQFIVDDPGANFDR